MRAAFYLLLGFLVTILMATSYPQGGVGGGTHPVNLASDVTGTLPIENGGTETTSLTDGGVLLGSGTDAITALAALADSEFLVGDGTTDPAIEAAATALTSIGVERIVKTGDTTVNDSATLVNATDLSFSVSANEKLIAIVIVQYNGNSTADLRQAFTMPAGSTLEAVGVHLDRSGTSSTDVIIGDATGVATGVEFNSLGGLGSRRGYVQFVLFEIGGTGGTVQYQFAQFTANASDTIMYAGSMLLVFRI